jgi:hypothetical protein
MRYSLGCALSLLLLPAVANAGGYVSLGVGDPPRPNGEVDRMFDRAGDMSGRLAIGGRFGLFAIEGDWTRGTMDLHATGQEWDSETLGASAKLLLPIFWRLDVVGRVGLTRTWVGPEDGDSRYVGNGNVLGGGLQLDIGLDPLLDAAIWAEYARHSVKLHDEAKVMDSIDGSFDTLMLGASVGF